MIVLNSTSDNLQIIKGITSDSELQFFASWRDRTSTTFIAGNSFSLTSGTSTVNAVTGPSNSQTQRLIDFISIYNPNSGNVPLSVILNSSGVGYTIFKSSLGSSDTLSYSEGDGFSLMMSSGSIGENNVEINPQVGNSLCSVATTQSYTTVPGATLRGRSMSDIPLYVPYPTGTGPSLEGGVYWIRGFFPLVSSSLLQGLALTLNLSTGTSNGVANALTASLTTPFRYFFSSWLPLSVNDSTALSTSATYNVDTSTSTSTVSLSPVPGGILSYISPSYGPQSPISYAVPRFSIETSTTAATALGTVRPGAILYFQRTY